MTLLEFLRDRIAEDQVAALRCRNLGAGLDDLTGWVEIGSAEVDAVEVLFDRFSPARVLAECAAKRRMLDLLDEAVIGWDELTVGYSPEDWLAKQVAIAWAQSFADHPDFNPEWVA